MDECKHLNWRVEFSNRRNHGFCQDCFKEVHMVELFNNLGDAEREKLARLDAALARIEQLEKANA